MSRESRLLPLLLSEVKRAREMEGEIQPPNDVRRRVRGKTSPGTGVAAAAAALTDAEGALSNLPKFPVAVQSKSTRLM